ncbi:disease resistance RPP8-like protein 3 isoform X1 [Daucus carota subsp. sativus]|uniref:disease resistance RPP8-like protein 3 isoform X1 n=1 Tax=Daucus carota subsp. sativus TaxID=79200 RepID=UPI003083D376
MADAVISFAIEKLGDFLVHQVNIRIGVRDDIRWLKEELGLLQATVELAESRQEEKLIRLWLNNVRDVANEAVDILKTFQDGQASLEQGHMDRFLNCICICKKEAQLYDIGNDIESLKKRIGVIKERRLEYGINTILAGPDLKQKERTFIRASAIDTHVDVVGFKDDIQNLMKELNSKDPPLKIISIHGMGGLGKTSLALKLYNSNELRHFGTRAKVCVSNEYTIKDVLKRIIKSFKGPQHEEYMSNMDEHDLRQYLQQLLENQGCYLVLIDDIWDIKAWNQIKIAFPNQDNGSRIMITTRNKKVAETVDKNCLAYQLRLLREEESWELFCKTAEPTHNLEKLGREMVGKCGGLPLAIVILGGLLLHNKSKDYWLKVKEHIWRNLRDDSVDIVEILSLSYKDLSHQMRDCFLYLARFPEDEIIDVERLKHLWIAEEFISEDEEGDGVLMEDLAEDCLNELINRNLIQINYSQLNGKVLACQVHDLVRELAIRKAKEQKNLVISDSSKHQPNLTHLLEGQRRHAIYDEIELSEFCFLPDSVEDLALSESGFTEDPMPSLGNLRNLTTLDLHQVYGGDIMVCSKNSFPSLQVLRLQKFTNLKELQVEDGALPCLKSFRIKKCEELKNIPVQLERILIQTN